MRYGSVCSGIEAASVAWHPLGWHAAFVSEVEAFPNAVLAHHYPDVPNFGDMTKFKDWPDVSIELLVGGTPCQSFSVAGLRAGLADPRGNLALTYLAIAAKYRPRWVVGRMSPASCHRAADGILVPSSGAWANSGMGSPTECLTLSSVEHMASPTLSRKDAAVCSLSDILETGDVPRRYYLTARACAGILRRAEKRGKQLPRQLAAALQAVADSEPTST